MMRLVANFIKAFLAAAGRVQITASLVELDEWTIAQRSGIFFSAVKVKRGASTQADALDIA